MTVGATTRHNLKENNRMVRGLQVTMLLTCYAHFKLSSNSPVRFEIMTPSELSARLTRGLLSPLVIRNIRAMIVRFRRIVELICVLVEFKPDHDNFHVLYKAS